MQVLAPVGIPLYDGVAVQEPYRFLHPTGDEVGSPSSFEATIDVAEGKSPEVQAFTAESPPQLQLILLRDALVLPPGATAVKVTIAPIEAPATAADGQIAGNVYRVSVTDQSGAPLALRSCAGCASMVLRAPDGIGPARIERFSNGAWAEVETIHAGVLGQYATNPKTFGDYAVVTGGPGGGEATGDGGGLGPTALIVGGGLTIVVILVIAAALAMRTRNAPPPPLPRSRAIPTKRKPRPKPRSGRPEQ